MGGDPEDVAEKDRARCVGPGAELPGRRGDRDLLENVGIEVGAELLGEVRVGRSCLRDRRPSE